MRRSRSLSLSLSLSRARALSLARSRSGRLISPMRRSLSPSRSRSLSHARSLACSRARSLSLSINLSLALELWIPHVRALLLLCRQPLRPATSRRTRAIGWALTAAMQSDGACSCKAIRQLTPGSWSCCPCRGSLPDSLPLSLSLPLALPCTPSLSSPSFREQEFPVSPPSLSRARSLSCSLARSRSHTLSPSLGRGERRRRQRNRRLLPPLPSLPPRSLFSSLLSPLAPPSATGPPLTNLTRTQRCV